MLPLAKPAAAAAAAPATVEESNGCGSPGGAKGNDGGGFW